MDSYASIWRLCKVPFFQLPKSPPQPHPSAAERCRVEYSLFGPIPQHLLSNYLCFDPIPLNSPSNQQQGCSSSLQYSQSPLNSVQDPRLSLSEICLDKNDQTTTPPCCSVCYEDVSLPDQGYEVREKQHTHTPMLCVMNFQDSLPPMPREEERNLGTRNSYGESSILLLQELKELALRDKDCVMDDDDDVGYMVSVMSKFRKLAFVSEVTLNSRYELMSELPEFSSLGNQSMKGLGSLIHCHSSVERLKSISKVRKRLFVDSDEPLLKKPKHSLG